MKDIKYKWKINMTEKTVEQSYAFLIRAETKEAIIWFGIGFLFLLLYFDIPWSLIFALFFFGACVTSMATVISLKNRKKEYEKIKNSN